MTNKPVFMSPLVQLPLLALTYAPQDQFIIMTSNSHKLHRLNCLMNTIVAKDIDRYHILGCENIDGFEAVVTGQKVDNDKVEPGIVAVAKQARAEFPKARAFLFECT